MQYRIVEKFNLFHIKGMEIGTQTTGFLWWKKVEQIETWRPVDENGYLCYHKRYMSLGLEFNNLHLALPPFESLQAARAKIKSFSMPAIIHHP